MIIYIIKNIYILFIFLKSKFKIFMKFMKFMKSRQKLKMINRKKKIIIIKIYCKLIKFTVN